MRISHTLLLTVAILGFMCSLSAQPIVQWKKCLGGNGTDQARAIQQTADGGYIVAGGTTSNAGDVTGNHGSTDFWVVKLSSSGTISWQKCLGGTGLDEANSVQQTADGGYIVAGVTASNDGDVSGNHVLSGSGNPTSDYWVVKLNSTGGIVWQKCLGGELYDIATSVQQTTDGGYIVTGTFSDVDVLNYGVKKLSSSGAIEWEKNFIGFEMDESYSIKQTTDGGYVVVGNTNTVNFNGVAGHNGERDIAMLKLSSTGTLEWQKYLGGSDYDYARSVQQTTDGGYIVAGYTDSNDGDVSGVHGPDAYDYWVVKLDNTGAIAWQKCLGGTGPELAYSVWQTTDGGYVVCGNAFSDDGDVTGVNGSNDYWVVKLNSSGAITWQKCLGGTGQDQARCIQQTTDGGYIVAGYTDSNDGDVSGNNGDTDFWVVKLDNSNVGIQTPDNQIAVSVYPNPANTSINIKVDASAIGKSYSFFNRFGQLVHTGTIMSLNTVVPLTAMPVGIYTVTVDGANSRSFIHKD